MKAVIAKQPGGPEVLQLVDIEQPVTQEGEVKIRVKAFGLNKAESYYRKERCFGTFQRSFTLQQTIHPCQQGRQPPSGGFPLSGILPCICKQRANIRKEKA